MLGRWAGGMGISVGVDCDYEWNDSQTRNIMPTQSPQSVGSVSKQAVLHLTQLDKLNLNMQDI